MFTLSNRPLFKSSKQTSFTDQPNVNIDHECRANGISMAGYQLGYLMNSSGSLLNLQEHSISNYFITVCQTSTIGIWLIWYLKSLRSMLIQEYYY